ncbi:aminoacyl-tRNA hydrolase, partial [Candidatus Uhrbacteria bacterium]|nr:aminoacyl-tRNA hydrolase [Candidatus Uhrbacteria bacterium]
TNYQLPITNLILVHDDIDLSLGTIRISKNASAGGHNGVQSIINALGTKEFTRLRIGVAGIARKRMDAAAYVLKRFSKTELPNIKKITATAREALSVILNEGPAKAMNLYNRLPLSS